MTECNNNLNELSGSAYSTNETLNIETINDNGSTRTKNYNWKILSSIGWYIYSYEQGIHEKTTNSSLPWKFQSFNHQSISRVGVVLGGNVAYGEISNTPTIGQYNAMMEIQFKVTYSFGCAGSPISTELFYTSSKNFNVND